MSGVPIETVVRLIEEANRGREESLYVSEMQPGAIMKLYDGAGGPLVGEIRFATEEIVWLDQAE